MTIVLVLHFKVTETFASFPFSAQMICFRSVSVEFPARLNHSNGRPDIRFLSGVFDSLAQSSVDAQLNLFQVKWY